MTLQPKIFKRIKSLWVLSFGLFILIKSSGTQACSGICKKNSKFVRSFNGLKSRSSLKYFPITECLCFSTRF